MRFQVVGANSESGDDVDVLLEAASQTEVEQMAHDKGILVATIKAVGGGAASGGNQDAISLVDDDPPPKPSAGASQAGASRAGSSAQGNGAVAASPEKHGTISLNANSPSESGHTTDGTAHEAHKSDAAMEYHILMNQALYLLETAVNKYLKDGWEPQGGLTVGSSNNAMQYFQALSRRKKV